MSKAILQGIIFRPVAPAAPSSEKQLKLLPDMQARHLYSPRSINGSGLTLPSTTHGSRRDFVKITSILLLLILCEVMIN